MLHSVYIVKYNDMSFYISVLFLKVILQILVFQIPQKIIIPKQAFSQNMKGGGYEKNMK
jgi:hypothetical protein